MKIKSALIIAFTALALTACAGKTYKTGPNGEKIASDGRICTYEKTTGSNIGRRVCRTPEQMESERAAAEELLRNQTRTGPVGQQ